MKFNYKDKTPKIDIPLDSNEIKNTEISKDTKIETFDPNTEIKLDIPSFGENNQETVFEEKKDNIASEKTTPTIPELKPENVNKYDFEPILDIPGTSENVFSSTNDIADKKEEKEKMTFEDLPTISFENTNSSNDIKSEINIESPYTSFEEFNSTLEENENEISQKSVFSENTVEDFKKEPILDFDNSVDIRKEIPITDLQNKLDEKLIFPNISDTTEITKIDNEIVDNIDIKEGVSTTPNELFTATENTNIESQTSNDISLDEVFDKKSKPKKEKIKKEKKQKEPKEKTNKKFGLPFGKKSKKAELLDRLDEITQETEENKTGVSDSLFSAFTETKNETIIENDLEIDKNIQIEETTFLETNKQNDINEEIFESNKEDINKSINIPITPFTGEVPDYKPNKDYDQFEIPDVLKENEMTPIDISPLVSQSPTVENPITDNKSNNESIFDFNANSTDSFDISTETSKTKKKKNKEKNEEQPKKKIKPIVIVAVLVVVLAILLIIFVVSLFSGNSKESNIPTPPPVTESVEIDKDTVNNLVEETQNIIENANSTTEEFIENNELPPQVGIDIDDEILEENTEILPTKTFANNSISFDYPKEWTEISSFNTRETDNNVSNIVMLGLTALDTEDTNNVRITVEETLTSVTAKDYVDKTENLMKESFTNIKMRKSAELTIAGREAPSRIYTFNDESGNSIEQFQIYVANGRDMYVITFTSSEENFMKNLDTYKEILKTIQIK